MTPMFDRAVMEDALSRVIDEFDESAPTVADWCERIYAAKDHQVSLADLMLLWRLYTEVTPPSMAANLVLHLMNRSGQDTSGMLDH